MPVIILLSVEGVLRLCNYGYPTSFFLSRQVQGRAMWIDNSRFGWRFFPRTLARMPHPLSMPQQKSPDTTRIFVFGESAALGMPAPEYGFSRMLQVLLSGRYPGRNFEVVNVSMVAINSHALLPIARECARRDGDLWVIYTGNNEAIGPFGAYGIFGSQAPPLPLIRANLALKRTRIGQLLDAAVQNLRGSDKETRWRGMEMYQERIGRDDPRINRVHANFQQNLDAILAAGQKARVPILLSTVAGNLKDCSPFGSRHGIELVPAQEPGWELGFETAVAREAEGNYAEALVQYQALAQFDPHYAELQFRLGRCALALGYTNAAQKYFLAAKDEDALQFRTDTRLNGIIRAAAASHADRGVRLLDAEAMFARQSTNGISGEEWFWEHVHFNFAGNYLLARAAAEAVADLLPPPAQPAPTHAAGWFSQAQCERELGLTDWGREQTLEAVGGLLAASPLTAQIVHSARMEKLQAEARRLRPMTRSFGIQTATRQLESLVARYPQDPERLQILAGLLAAANDLAGAEHRWRQVIQLLPQAPAPCLNLARLLEKQNRRNDAAWAYEECLKRNPDTAEALGRLGELRLQQGRPADAIPLFHALARQERSATAYWLLGQALWRANRQAEARAQFERVLKLDPEHAGAKGYLNG